LDILAQLYLLRPSPGYVAKVEMKKWPAFGYLSEVNLQSLFVKREGSPDGKAKVLQDIKHRQTEAAAGRAAPLVIFPEGCTTNGSGIVTFKKGAFDSLLPV
jgi:lysophosphatidylcholine acyltransferase / lyso-PAF acetyltransferase